MTVLLEGCAINGRFRQKLDLNNKGDGRVLQTMSIRRLRLPIFQGGSSLRNTGPALSRKRILSP